MLFWKTMDRKVGKQCYSIKIYNLGGFRIPLRNVVTLILAAIKSFAEENPHFIKNVRIVVFEKKSNVLELLQERLSQTKGKY